jgi:hypothetical protein
LHAASLSILTLLNGSSCTLTCISDCFNDMVMKEQRQKTERGIEDFSAMTGHAIVADRILSCHKIKPKGCCCLRRTEIAVVMSLKRMALHDLIPEGNRTAEVQPNNRCRGSLLQHHAIEKDLNKAEKAMPFLWGYENWMYTHFDDEYA